MSMTNGSVHGVADVGVQAPVSDDSGKPLPSGRRACIGPGRSGQEFCGRPTDTKSSELCRDHRVQQKKQGVLQPLRTRTRKSTCIGPGQDGGLCGRRVSYRPLGQDDGVCKTHYDQLKRRGSLGPIELRRPPLTDSCNGPGRDGSELCERPAEAHDTLLCSPHDRQLKKNGVLKPIRKVNTPDAPCIGPGLNGRSCGRPMANKTLGLCGGHYAQHREGKTLTPVKVVRKRGDITRCRFSGCRYNDAPGAEGYCHHHWRQLQADQALAPLTRKANRGKSVLDRDENGNKLCGDCREWKPESAFTKTSAARDGFNYVCQRCHASNRLEARYGIDLDHYEALLAAQDGHCKLCPRRPEANKRLNVDHNHRCCPGELSCGHCIRGLLCTSCNQGLGKFQENGDILMRAAHYVLLNDAAFDVLKS